MPLPRDFLLQLIERRDLSQAQAEELLTQLTDPQLPPALAGALLSALAAKGVVADEARGFAQAMRRLARRPPLPAGLRAIDIVGTGGDASGSLNISTGTALLTAACGVPVVKHGNRSVSSRCGSADVLEELGLPVPLEEAAAAACLAATGFTFLFAPHYHPATRAITPIRAALGVRTVFNILGPLVNPAQPPLHLVGAYSLDVARLIAHTFQACRSSALSSCTAPPAGTSPHRSGRSPCSTCVPVRLRDSVRTPEAYGLTRCAAADLAGGDARHNAAAIRAVLRGEAHGAHRDCLLLGTALALEVAGEVHSAPAGMARAAAAIESGSAARLLEALARHPAAAGSAA